MKKILFLCSSLVFLSCDTNPNKTMIKNAETYVLKNTNNPKSFEFVDFKVVDTLKIDKDEEYYKSLEKDSANYAQGISVYENWFKEIDKAIADGKANEIDIQKRNDIKIKEIVDEAKIKVDSISYLLKSRREKYFNKDLIRTEYRYRATNEMNAVVLYDKIIIFNDNSEILDFIDK